MSFRSNPRTRYPAPRRNTLPLPLPGYEPVSIEVARAWMQVPSPAAEIDTAVDVARAWMQVSSVAVSASVAQAWLKIQSFDAAAMVAQAWLKIASIVGGPGDGTGGPIAEDPTTPGGIDPVTGQEIVVTFNRMLPAVDFDAPAVPRGMESRAQWGTLQSRSTVSAGLRWRETYQPVLYTDPRWWRFHAYITELAQNERIFLISMPEWVNFGTVVGTPLVNGADQTGYQIITDGWTGDMKLGDFIKIAGIDYVFRVMGDVTGPGTILVHPAIRQGGSPADNAVITYGDVLVQAKIHDISDYPQSGPSGIYHGLAIDFWEVP